MIKSITAITQKSEELKLELGHPEKTGLIVQKITGLGPPKAIINTTELAMVDGGIFNSIRTDKRNIVISLAMMFSPTIEDARLKTYHYFPIKQKITLRIETDRKTAEIQGYVESNEPDIFNKQETTQISIICPNPYFYDVEQSQTSFLGVHPMFEFPFSNESLEEPLLNMGEIVTDTRANLYYEGDVSTGILIEILAKEALTNDISLYNVRTHETLKILANGIEELTGKGFSQGDFILISTYQGKKTAELLRDGVYYNVISSLDDNPSWFQLTPGDNIFNFDAGGDTAKLAVTFTYRNTYGGV